MSRLLRFDHRLLGTAVGLLVLGLVMIYSSSAVIALNSKGNPNYFFVRQTVWALVGIIALLTTLKIPYSLWQKRKVVLTLLAVELLLLLTALVSPTINGSHRWIRLWKITLQPSESAKFVLVVFTAYMLDKRLREGKEWIQFLLPFGIISGLLCSLVLIQPDLGTVVVIGTVAATLLFAAGLPWRWIALLFAAGCSAMVPLIIGRAYRLQRLMTFLHPNADPQNTGFQARQSLVAVGSGGLFGNWFGGGSQKFMFLPEPHTDFIYAMIAEGFGLLGALIVLGLFIYLGYRGLEAVKAAPDAFGAYLALGIVAWIVVQAFLHIMVTLTLLPTKGLPLPLVSYGGSNLVVTMAGLGVLLNVSQNE